MPLTPETYDKLTEQYRRFDSFPEAKRTAEGYVVKHAAFLAFLEARRLIEQVRMDLFRETKAWQPIPTFFETEPETPMVLLWEPRDPDGVICLGYWDDDAQEWYREGCGADLESEPLNPTKWMALRELMRSADDREYVAIARMD
jgi:hypothetical protein